MIFEALAGTGAHRRSGVAAAVVVAASLTVMQGPGAETRRAQEQPVSEQRAGAAPRAEPPASLDASAAYCLQRFLQPFHAIDPTTAPPSPVPDPEPNGLQTKAFALQPRAALPASPPAPDARVPVTWERELDTTVAAMEALLPKNGKLLVQIAMVADPIDSGLSYQFDTQLRALRLGFERQLEKGRAFYRDRSWLPWDDRGVAGDKQSDSKECRRSTPGVLLFRGNKQDHPRVLALLVVGESPTSGVHTLAMKRALQVAERFARSERGESDRLEINGPTFSGSTQSLKTALDTWLKQSAEPERPRFDGDWFDAEACDEGEGRARCPPVRRPLQQINIRTGAATGPMVATDLRESPGEDWLKGHQVSFSATTPPEVAVQCSYLMYLRCRLGVGRGYFEGCASEGVTHLAEVALLHESGTEFGANYDEPGREGFNGPATENFCKVRPGLDLSFPVHVSALRDAYEAADRSGDNQPGRIGRRTHLPVSLHEKPPQDLDVEPTARTTYAQDVALTNVLGAITQASVRHVGIQATDIGDAIFLARKIRDVAPDVRIAFFTSDVLLLHSEFARDLEGSLMVSPYPFLGTNYLATEESARGRPFAPQHHGFENATSLAVFNAVLASRGAAARDLREYVFTSAKEILPIWTSVIGGGVFVPISVGPSRDGDETIDLGRRADPCCTEGSRGLKFGAGPRPPYDERRRELRQSRLTAAETATIPRLWHVVFALVALGWAADWALRRRALSTLCRSPAPASLGAEHDHRADLAMSRAKWRLYGWIRSVVLAGVTLYMGTLYLVAYRVYPAFDLPVLVALVIGAVVVGALLTARRSSVAFRRDYRDLALRGAPRWRLAWWVRARASKPYAGSVGAAATSSVKHRGSAEPHRPAGADGATFWNGAVQLLGFARPLDRRLAGLTSVAQLRALRLLTWTLIGLFALGELMAVFDEWSLGEAIDGTAAPAATLWVLRSMVVVGAASPAAPTLLCALIVYVWATGRMARLRLVHGLCRMAPPRATLELVSTPLRAVLYPALDGVANDDGFARVERGVVNAILRPMTGPQYATALAVFAFLPIVPFVLKPPSTLERDTSTVLLAAGLALAALLIGSTLIQLVQYWLALDFMLKRIAQHPLGTCFTRVDPLVRGSADEQLSRTPSDVLRLATCQVRFDELVREGRRLGREELVMPERLHEHNLRLSALAHGAVTAATDRPLAEATLRESKLGQAVIDAAAEVTNVLARAWDGRLQGAGAKPSDDGPAARPAGTNAVHDALSARAGHFSDAELRWLRHAEELVATVVAFLVSRHVRQLPFFVSTLLTSVLLLMLAVQSYPFEPHRLMSTCIWVLVAAVVVTALWVYFSVQRNTLLSEIAGTEPGKVTWDGALIVRVLAWGIVPVLGVTAVQYPDVANSLLRFLEPFTRALK